MSDLKKRPSKKQREILSFIEDFINQHGYGPSYREVARGLNYRSVATVSVHINNLIDKGLLNKRGKSARSLEVVGSESTFHSNQVSSAQEKWLVEIIEGRFKEVERLSSATESDIDPLYVLVGALQVLGLDGAASAFKSRLNDLNK